MEQENDKNERSGKSTEISNNDPNDNNSISKEQPEPQELPSHLKQIENKEPKFKRNANGRMASNRTGLDRKAKNKRTEFSVYTIGNEKTTATPSSSPTDKKTSIPNENNTRPLTDKEKEEIFTSLITIAENLGDNAEQKEGLTNLMKHGIYGGVETMK